MTAAYQYYLRVTCRQRGADGLFEAADFTVLMPKEWNTPAELFDKWLSQHGDRLEPGVMDRVNGEFTRGMHGHHFRGSEACHVGD